MSITNSLIKVSKLGKGIHDNVVITKVDPEEHKYKGAPIKKMLYITYATIDPETKKRKHEVELSWWYLDPTSTYFFSNLRELCIQLHNILSCYMTEEEAFEAMSTALDGYEFTSVADIENYKWKKKEVDDIQDKLKSLFVVAITPFIGIDKTPIRLKVSVDSKGENAAYPSYGVFAERMSVNPTMLKFSDSELKMQSKAGNTTTATSRLSSAAATL